MTVSLIVRSFFTLVVAIVVTAVTITHTTIPPRSALQAALDTNDSGSRRAVIPTPPPYGPNPTVQPSVMSTGRSGSQSAAKPTPTATAITIQPRMALSDFFDVPGHIFYTGPDHNIWFITGQHAHTQFTGDGASVSPALSPDGQKLAWVQLERSYSDVEVTNLRLESNGAVQPITTTTLTQDKYPPPALQRSPNYGYDPRYWWWATKPAWLPDSRHILYISDRPGYDPNDEANVAMSIWEQSIDGVITNAVGLSLPQPVVDTSGHDSPQWRPHDPSTFLYVNYYLAADRSDQGIIEVGEALTGTAPITPAIDLSPQGTLIYQPTWSSDGRFITFVEDIGHNKTNLLVMPFHPPGDPNDFNKAVVVATGAPYVTQPFWSPAGHYLGYLVGGNGDFSMVIRRVYYEGKELRFGPPIALPQAGPVSAEYRPSWGP
ncbi:MAG TPA: hypothetical protein VFE42_31015 [Chloroflexota bacterium]|nr:hypothetical protein [Chloroflexota bacterium]